MNSRKTFLYSCTLALGVFGTAAALDAAPVNPATAAQSVPLASVRLLDGPFTRAVEANREYLLALDPDRLLAPFLREAGLTPKKPSYGNWENSGLDGHTAGHYLAALANMIASGDDTKEGELNRRLDYMLDELERCQKANGNGYIGGVPDSKNFWPKIARGDVGEVWKKWVPWYNIHKTYAGLRDAYQVAGKAKARVLLVGFSDWCVNIISGLTDAQMQQMLGNEYGGMNETLADVYAITGDEKYLKAAERFNHRSLLEPLERGEDKLTGLHANTQIPKVIGFERIATLTGDKQLDAGARFFWETVTKNRSVAFGGNSVSEHFHDPKDFSGMLRHREGPETCNTYNMLRLTEQLFDSKPSAAYADYYERALFNHILASINPVHPGYVYFTPIRPEHYRVYSQPDESFWCCVGTGMENPGKYAQFVYSRAADGLYVNLFIASELTVSPGFVVRQETRFPDEESSLLRLKLAKPSTFSLRLRHPAWVAADGFAVKINGKRADIRSTPSSYVELRREWRDGDVVEISLPMRTTVERLPDGSNWVAILHGPILLANPDGTERLDGLRAGDARMGHVAWGPEVPLDQIPSILTGFDELPAHVVPDKAAGPLHFRLVDVVVPAADKGLSLAPFFSMHDTRYQMYWELTTAEQRAARQEKLAAQERAKAAYEAATIDRVAIGEQQSEVEHDFKSENSNTGIAEGRRWRDGAWFEYSLNTRGAQTAALRITYWGGDAGRAFDILVDGQRIANKKLTAEKPGKFFTDTHVVPPELLAKARDGRITVRFAATQWIAGGVFDVRLMKSDAPEAP